MLGKKNEKKSIVCRRCFLKTKEKLTEKKKKNCLQDKIRRDVTVLSGPIISSWNAPTDIEYVTF